MILELISQLITLILVLILLYFTARYRNWRVAVVILLGIGGIAVGEQAQDTNVLFAFLNQVEIGLLVYLLYDYMRLTHLTRAFRIDTQAAALIEASDYAIVGMDLDGKIISWNRAAERLFGYREKDIKGKSINVIVPDDVMDEHNAMMNALARGQGVEKVTHRCTIRKRKINVEVTKVPVRDPIGGSIIGASAIYKEVDYA